MSRSFVIGAAALVAAVVGYLSFAGIGENLVYYWTPTELRAAGTDAVGATVRLGGLVEPGSVRHEGSTLKFRVTDGTTAVEVETTAVPPQMFREGIGVVVEGTPAEGPFRSSRLLVKHDETYRAPAGGQVPEDRSSLAPAP